MAKCLSLNYTIHNCPCILSIFHYFPDSLYSWCSWRLSTSLCYAWAARLPTNGVCARISTGWVEWLCCSIGGTRNLLSFFCVSFFTFIAIALIHVQCSGCVVLIMLCGGWAVKFLDFLPLTVWVQVPVGSKTSILGGFQADLRCVSGCIHTCKFSDIYISGVSLHQ